VTVSQVDQVDGVPVSRDYVGQLLELVGEQGLQVRRVRVVARIVDFERLAFMLSVNDKDTCLVPDRDQEGAVSDGANLGDVLAGEHFVLRKNKLIILEGSKEQTVSAPECILVWLVSGYNFVNITSENFLLAHLHQSVLPLHPNDVNVALVLARNDSSLIDDGQREDVALGHDTVD